MSNAIQVEIPFESLVAAIKSLDVEQQRALFDVLDEMLFDVEEEQLENDPTVLAEVHEAREAYHRGDYQTIQDYISTQTS